MDEDPLAGLDEMMGAQPTHSGPKPDEPLPIFDELPPYVSPTLLQIDAQRRPQPSTICEGCPASLWHGSATEIRCYCRIMHSYSWTAEEPTALTHCDGEIEANLARLAQFESKAPPE